MLGEHPVALAGAPVDWTSTRRLLVVRPDNLGDVVLAGPALRALRVAAPAARIDLLASPAGALVAPLLPEVNGTLVVSPVWQDAGNRMPQDPARELALVERLRRRRYDAVVILTSFSQSPWPAAYVAYLAGVPVRIGMSKEFGGSVLTHWALPPPDRLHQVDRALHLLGAVGVPAAGTDMRLAIPRAAAEAAAGALAAAGVHPTAPYAVLAPGASCPSRRYPPDRFRAVAAALAAAGLPVAVAGAASERDLVGAVADQARPGVVPLAGAVDVPGLAAVLAGAAVAVTNNSGGMHLADAAGTPLVVLFAGTELEEQYRPRGGPAVLLRRPTDCVPCRAFRCPFGLECLDVPPERVTDAALALARSPQPAVDTARIEAAAPDPPATPLERSAPCRTCSAPSTPSPGSTSSSSVRLSSTAG